MVTDLTEGKPAKILWKFSIPMLISVIFQQLYNIADSVIVGKFAENGEDALAAVGASYPITMIFMAVAMGCNIGCSVVVSQLFGGKEYTKMKTAVTTTYIASLIMSLILTIAGLLFCQPLMELLNTPDNIFDDGALYLKIYIYGLPFLFLYNVCTGIFNALGDSKTPLYFLIGSSVGNILLDYIFVSEFEMRVAGVAWATFIAQGISCVLAFLTLVHKVKKIKTKEKAKIFSGSMLKRISVIAIPSILQQSFISVGNLFIQRVVNGFGSGVVAGYSAAIKLNTFALTSFTTFSNGLSTFTAQNIGAGKVERIKEGFKAGIKMAVMVVIPFFLFYFLCSNQAMHIFMNEGSVEAVAIGNTFLKIVAPFYFVIAIKLMADGVLRGAGSMLYFMIATFTDLVIRVILAYTLSSFFDSTGIWVSWPIGWITAAVLSVGFYLKGVWKRV